MNNDAISFEKNFFSVIHTNAFLQRVQLACQSEHSLFHVAYRITGGSSSIRSYPLDLNDSVRPRALT